MSHYSEKEICGDCMHAEMFECGNCLKVCNVDAADERDFYSGKCPLKLKDRKAGAHRR